MLEITAKFDHFNVNVTDLDRSLAFYRQALGFREVRRKEAADGSFEIYCADWSEFGGTFSAAQDYIVVLYIADNGAYDLDKDEGKIIDPTAVVKYAAPARASSGGSGGGCSAGFGAAALFALPALWLFGGALRKRAR